MDKIPDCFGGGSFELTEEEQKEYEKSRQIMHEAETEYLHYHHDFSEDRKKEFWDTLNLLFDGSNEIPLKIINVIGTRSFNRIIRNTVTEMSRIRMEGLDNANRAYFRGKRDAEQS